MINMTREGLKEQIRQLPLFTSLPLEEVQSLSDCIDYREFPEGTVLFREGEIGDRFSILLKGQVAVLNEIETPEERLLAILGPGDFLGEMSAVYPGRRRSASARTISPVELLEISHEQFEILLERYPGFALTIMRELSIRLRNSEQDTIRDLREKNTQLATAYQELKAAQAQLIEKEKIEHELEMARTIQQGFLPKEIPNLPGWEIQAYWQPAHAVGGDFYDFITFPGGEVGIVIGDVTGKGIPAALVMATTSSILRAISSLIDEESLSPGALLASINELLVKQMQPGMFVTCLLAVLDPAQAKLQFANAGHCLPYMRTPGGVLELCATGMPLGLLPGMDYQDREINIPANSQLLLYSDGLIEAHNPNLEMFDVDRLKQSLASTPAGYELIPFLIEQLGSFTGPGWEQEDDITFVSLKRHAL